MKTSYHFARHSLNAYIRSIDHDKVGFSTRDDKWRVIQYARAMVYVAFYYARITGVPAKEILRGRGGPGVPKKEFNKHCRRMVKRDQAKAPFDLEELLARKPTYVRDFIQSHYTYKPWEARDVCLAYFISVLDRKTRKQ